MSILKGVTMTNLGPKVDIDAVFGQDVSYASLAAAFHVNAYDILVELCKIHGTNEKAFDDIYRAFMAQHTWLTHYGDRATQVEQYWAQAHGGTSAISQQNLPFLAWRIPKAVVIRLPASAKTAPLVHADAEQASRYIELAIECPDFSKLELVTKQVQDAADALTKKLDELERAVRTRSQECLPYLVSAQRLLLMMYDAIPDNAEAIRRHHLYEHIDLFIALRGVVEDAASLLSSRPDRFDWYLHAEVDERTEALVELIGEPDAISCLAGLTRYYDVAEQREVWARFESALLAAGSALSRSSYGATFVERHLMPMFAEIAALADVDELARRVEGTPLHRALLDDWREVVPGGQARSSLFGVMGTIGSVGAGAVGNSRGPASLAVALMVHAGPASAKYLGARSLALSRSGTLGTAISLRVLMRVADFSAAVDLDHLVTATLGTAPEKAIAAIDDIDWSTKLMSGNGWAMVYALANLAVLLSLVTDDEQLSLERFGQALQAASQSAVPVAELASSLLARRGHGARAIKAIQSAEHLAQFAGLLAVALAVWTITKHSSKMIEDRSFDIDGLINVAGSAGTLVSVGAWFYAASSKLAAAFMLGGSVLSVLAAVVAIGYHIATRGPGTATYIRACLEGFEASTTGAKLLDDPAFAKSFAQLRETLDDVKHELVSFAGKQDELFTLFRWFSADGCATIVELEPALVHEILGVP